jgi:hypothetical protein
VNQTLPKTCFNPTTNAAKYHDKTNSRIVKQVLQDEEQQSEKQSPVLRVSR